MATLEAQIAILEAKSEICYQTIEERRELISNNINSIEDLQASAEEWKEQLNELRDKRNEEEGELENWKNEESLLDDYDQSDKKNRGELSYLDTSEIKENIEELKRDIEDLDEKIDKFENVIGRIDEEIETFEIENKEHEDTISECENTIIANESKIENLETKALNRWFGVTLPDYYRDELNELPPNDLQDLMNQTGKLKEYQNQAGEMLQQLGLRKKTYQMAIKKLSKFSQTLLRKLTELDLTTWNAYRFFEDFKSQYSYLASH